MDGEVAHYDWICQNLGVEVYLLIDTSVELLHSYGPSFALLTPPRASHAPSARCAGGWEFIVPNHLLFVPSAYRFRTAVSLCPRSRESRRVTSSPSARCGDDHSFEEVGPATRPTGRPKSLVGVAAGTRPVNMNGNQLSGSPGRAGRLLDALPQWDGP